MNYKIKQILKKIIQKTPLWKIREYQTKQRFLKKNKYFHLEAVDLLNKFSTIMNDNNILFWLDFGTLLGYYRDGDFIKHDIDLDFGVFLKDAPMVKKVLLENKFKLVRQFFSIKDGGMEECYLYKHTTFDIFYYRKDLEKKSIYCNSFSSIPAQFKGLNKMSPAMVKRIDLPDTNFKQVEYKNSSVYVPDSTEQYLKLHYGKNFMIPNPDFDYKKEATNITYFDYEDMPGEFIISM